MTSQQNRNVLHFKAGFLSPTETFVFNQIRYLQRFHSTVICKFRKKSPFDLGAIPVYTPPSLLPWKLDRMITGVANLFQIPFSLFIRKFVPIARSINPAIIHAHFGPDGAYILPLSRMLGVPLVTSFYGYDVSEFPRRFRGRGKRYYQLLIRHGDCFIAMTSAMRDDLISLGFPIEKIIIHHYGINVDEFACALRSAGTENKKINLLQVGSLGGKKGQIYVLKALNKILQEEKALDVNILFVGRGPAEEELRNYVREHDMQNRVTFRGFISHGEELKKIFGQSDIFIHSSITLKNGDKEGLPTTILEAMSAGLPVIATKHAGIPEAVIDGSNGILVDEYDVDALARAIVILANDGNKRVQYGAQARKTVVDKYDIQNRIKELENIYFNVISSYNIVS